MGPQAAEMRQAVAAFLALLSQRLPDDVEARLREMAAQETDPLTRTIYESMFRNQDLARTLGRPSCQDTGILQFWVKCGTRFPLMEDVEEILRQASAQASADIPLRPNCVETFDEINTGTNIGTGVPTLWWEPVPRWDGCEIYVYMAGGGCALPAYATALMPGEGYGGIADFVLRRMTDFGVNACPPLLVGVGVAATAETAAVLSKKALMRPIGSHSENPRAAEMERLLEDSINAIGFGPQGLGGKRSVMGVHVEHSARHPAALGAAVSVGCWSHRRGHLRFQRDLSCEILSHKGVALL